MSQLKTPIPSHIQIIYLEKDLADVHVAFDLHNSSTTSVTTNIVNQYDTFRVNRMTVEELIDNAMQKLGS